MARIWRTAPSLFLLLATCFHLNFVWPWLMPPLVLKLLHHRLHPEVTPTRNLSTCCSDCGRFVSCELFGSENFAKAHALPLVTGERWLICIFRLKKKSFAKLVPYFNVRADGRRKMAEIFKKENWCRIGNGGRLIVASRPVPNFVCAMSNRPKETRARERAVYEK